MQGVERDERELLDAAALVGHLVPEGSVFAFLATHRRDLFPDKGFADLFPSDRGRRSMPGSVGSPGCPRSCATVTFRAWAMATWVDLRSSGRAPVSICEI